MDDFTKKQANKTFAKNIFVYVVNNSILTNSKGETKLYSVLFGQIFFFNNITKIFLVIVLFASFFVL